MENTVNHLPARTVIVGSRGRMGAMLCARGRHAGLDITELDQPLAADDVARACRGVALAVICVPAMVFGSVLARICPHLPPGAVLCDITSVKEEPLRQMAAAWNGPVVGTHPLFGPRSAPGQDRPVAIVPGPRSDRGHVDMVSAFFQALGCRVFKADAAAHDRAMASIQNMNFITSLAYFALLAGHDELLPYLTPSFMRRMEAARKMLTEDARMFAGLFEANAYSHEEVRKYRKMLALAASGDIDLLCHLASWWWPDKKAQPGPAADGPTRRGTARTHRRPAPRPRAGVGRGRKKSVKSAP